MALITCKKCGREVSEHALTCPYCEISEPGSDPERAAKSAARRSTRIALFIGAFTLIGSVAKGSQFVCGKEYDFGWHAPSLVCDFLFLVDYLFRFIDYLFRMDQ
jgi:hypothetical protein